MRRPTKQSVASRCGITLFEVVLALAIFLGATAVIGQILQNGSRAATRAQLTAEAAIRCERRMNEVLSGVLPLASAQRAPFEDNGNWLWTLNVVETGIPYLLETQVVVEYVNSSGVTTETFSLNRMMRDPQLYEEVALLSEEEL